MACSSTGPHDHQQWNTDLYDMMIHEAAVLRRLGFAIVALGDYNAKVGKIPGMDGNHPNLNSNSHLFSAFVKSLNLTILNTLPISEGLFTHFVEREGLDFSESVLDYGLADPDLSTFITSFIIDSDARVDCGTDHALISTTFEFNGSKIAQRTVKSDIIKFKLPLDKDYSCFDKHFTEHPQLPAVGVFNSLSVEEMASILTTVLFDACHKSFHMPEKNKRPKRRHWLPPDIVKQIKIRRIFQTKLCRLQTEKRGDKLFSPVLSKLEALLYIQRSKVRVLLSEFKQRRAARVRNRLLKNETKLGNFWKFLRHHCRSTQQLSASYDEDGKVVFDQEEISKQVHRQWSDVFSGQSEPVFNSDTLPPLPSLPDDHPLLDFLPKSPPTKHESHLCRPFSETTLKEALNKLKDNKSCGVDNIPSEVLKYSGESVRAYLLGFYNKIWEHGIVPQQLNTIKCVLIHKKGDSLNTLNYR